MFCADERDHAPKAAEITDELAAMGVLQLGISQSDVFVDAPSEEEDEGEDAEAPSVGQGVGQNDKEVVQPAAIPVEQEEVETEASAVDEAAGLGGPADVAEEEEEEEEYAAAVEELGEEEEKPEEKEKEDKLAAEEEEEGVPVEKGFVIPEGEPGEEARMPPHRPCHGPADKSRPISADMR